MAPKFADGKVPLRWLLCALCAPLVVPTTASWAQETQQDVPSATGESREPIASAKKEESAPTKEQCVDSHHQAQRAQMEGQLVRARELSRTCTSLTCPGLIVTDCARWLYDLDQRIPSVVFEVRVDGQTNLTAAITADGNSVTEWTRGESFRLDPGEHQFRFELAPFQPVMKKVLLSEGMRYRIVEVEFKSQSHPLPLVAIAPTAPVVPPPSTSERPTPLAIYSLLGVGVLSLASFATFSVMGKSKQSSLESRCMPHCSDRDLQPMKSAYLVGDVSLGISAASLVAAGTLYFASPEKAIIPAVGIAPLTNGAAVFSSYQF